MNPRAVPERAVMTLQIALARTMIVVLGPRSAQRAMGIPAKV
jgi:hypothetical protein